MKKKKGHLFEAHPNKVIIRISKHQWNSLFSNKVKKTDGTEVKLFVDTEAEPGFDRRFQQNVSVAKVVAVGENIKGIIPGDMAIIDYVVSNDDNILIGYIGGDRLCAMNAKTTYHHKDAIPNIDGRKTFKIGDFDTISPLLGVVRNKQVISFDPYVFVVHEFNPKMSVNEEGLQVEKLQPIVEREVLCAPEGEFYKGGDTILIKEADLFTRTIDEKEICCCMKQDVLCKK